MAVNFDSVWLKWPNKFGSTAGRSKPNQCKAPNNVQTIQIISCYITRFKNAYLIPHCQVHIAYELCILHVEITFS